MSKKNPSLGSAATLSADRPPPDATTLERSSTTQARERSDSLDLALITMLYENVRAPVIGSFGAGALMVWGLWPEADRTAAIWWLSALFLVLALRFGSFLAFKRRTLSTAAIQLWHRWFLVGVFTTGALWGAASVILVPAHEPSYQALIGLTVAGVSAAGAVTLGASWQAVIAYVFPALLPLAISFYSLGTRVGLFLGLLTLVFLFFLVISSKRIVEMLRSNHHLQLEIADRMAELSAVFDNVNQFLALLTPDGNIVRCNNTALDWANGLPLEEGVPLWQGPWWQPEDRDRLRNDLRRAQRGEAAHHEKILGPLSGIKRVVDFALHPVLSNEGQVVLLVASGTDITERVAAEQIVEISERKFRTLVEGSLAGVYIVDKGRFIYVNPTLAKLFGYTPDEIINEKSIADLVYEPDRETVLENIRARSEGEIDTLRYQFRGLNKSGEIVHVEVLGNRSEIDGHQVIIGTLLDITDHTRSRERIQTLANYDELTKLPNRRFLYEQAERAVTDAVLQNRPLGVMYLDLDHFKNVNDTLGHDAGDKLLIDVAGRLKACLRSTDILARLGGDEFAFVLPGASHDIAENVAQRVVRVVSEPFYVMGSAVRVGGSVGVAQITDEHEDINTLFKRADIAMYHAKRERGSYAFYRPGQEQETKRRLTMESELTTALKNGEFFLVYQPRVDLTNGRCDSVEALLRWRHPTRGFIPPMEFIPVAEETNLIVEIGAWVLDESLSQLQQWREQGIDLRMAVNLSLRELRDADVVARTKRILECYGIEGSLLELEVTESTAMSDPEESVQTLLQLRELGVEIAIDDFGTGYSSLNYLKQLPASYLKVDRSFVGGIGGQDRQSKIDEGIVKVVSALAESLGIKVIAEGVETDTQLQFLIEQGCQFAQGYYLAKPMPEQEVRDLMSQRPEFLSLVEHKSVTMKAK